MKKKYLEAGAGAGQKRTGSATLRGTELYFQNTVIIFSAVNGSTIFNYIELIEYLNFSLF